MSAFCREHDNKLYVTSVVPRRFLVQKILLIQLIIFNPVSFIYISYRFSERAVVLGRKEALGRIRIKYGGRSIHIDSANEKISVLKEIERPADRAINLEKISCPNNHCTDSKKFFLTYSCCVSVIVTHSGK